MSRFRKPGPDCQARFLRLGCRRCSRWAAGPSGGFGSSAAAQDPATAGQQDGRRLVESEPGHRRTSGSQASDGDGGWAAAGRQDGEVDMRFAGPRTVRRGAPGHAGRVQGRSRWPAVATPGAVECAVFAAAGPRRRPSAPGQPVSGPPRAPGPPTEEHSLVGHLASSATAGPPGRYGRRPPGSCQGSVRRRPGRPAGPR